MSPGPGDQKDLGRYLALGQIGIEMAAPVGLGYLADQYLGCSPWGVILGAGIGFAGGLYQLVRMTSPKPKDRGGQPTGKQGSERTP